MSFDSWLSDAWNRHADDAAGVAGELDRGSGLVTEAAQIGRLAHLAHHVLGEHLARWADATGLVTALRGHAAADAASDATLRVYLASLRLCAARGGPFVDTALDTAAQVRAQALAATALAPHDISGASALFSAALAGADALPAAEGAHLRPLAVSANNLACTLEEKSGRSAAERDLMIAAAQAARRYWALAGGWLETERAEYRLARTWLQAGDPARARHHAGLCLEIVQAQAAPPLERFFAWEALALAAHAGADGPAVGDAVTQAHAEFAALDDADRAWCQPTLDTLNALDLVTPAR